MTRSIQGRSRVYQRVTRQPFIERGASGGGTAFSLAMAWLTPASSAPLDGFGNEYAAYTYAQGASQTGGLEDYASPSGGGDVSLSILATGAARGAGPYNTDPVIVATSTPNRTIGAFVLWYIPGLGFSGAPSALTHPDLTLSNIEETVTNGGAGYQTSPYGRIGDYFGDAPNAAGVSAPISIPTDDNGYATAACWIVFALDDCAGGGNQGSEDSSPDVRVLTWTAPFTTEMLIGAVGRVPGRAVSFASPWNTNAVHIIGTI